MEDSSTLDQRCDITCSVSLMVASLCSVTSAVLSTVLCLLLFRSLISPRSACSDQKSDSDASRFVLCGPLISDFTRDGTVLSRDFQAAGKHPQVSKGAVYQLAGATVPHCEAT